MAIKTKTDLEKSVATAAGRLVEMYTAGVRSGYVNRGEEMFHVVSRGGRYYEISIIEINKEKNGDMLITDGIIN